MKNQALITLLAVFVFGFCVITPARADWLLDRSGYLLPLDSLVLGDSDAQEVETTKSENKSEEVLRETQKRTLEQAREQSQKQSEVAREAAKQKLENQLELNKKRAKSNVETTLQNENGRLKIKQSETTPAGKHQETELELESNESLRVEGQDGELTEIKPEVSEIKNELELKKNRIKAKTDLDLKIDSKNEITVTLPNGKEKSIEVPDHALNNLVSKGIIAPLNGESDSYKLITNKAGEPVYQAEGTVEKKVFGLFKMKVAQKLEVAASDSEDGSTVAGDIVNVETTETNPLRRFFARFAI